jgi:predicted RNase H-like HicB family nuclease
VEVKSYRVTARRSGKWWAFQAPDVPGAVGQARRLEQVEHEARDVLSMMLNVPEESIEVELVPELDDATARAVSDVRHARREAELAGVAALTLTVITVKSLRRGGLPVRDVADLLGLSYQRVSQLAREDVGELQERKRRLEAGVA